MAGILTFYTGPMCAGKSLGLFDKFSELTKDIQDETQKPLMILPAIKVGGREGKGIATSRGVSDGVSALYFNELDDNVFALILKNPNKSVFIDEGQFFGNLKEFCLRLKLETSKDIYVAGLNSSFTTAPWAAVSNLETIAEIVHHLTARCDLCPDGIAIHSKRLGSSSSSLVDIDVSHYVPCCTRCYHK